MAISCPQENISKRATLRHHPLVVAALSDWWKTVQRLIHQDGGSGDELYKQNYLTVMKKVRAGHVGLARHFHQTRCSGVLPLRGMLADLGSRVLSRRAGVRISH